MVIKSEEVKTYFDKAMCDCGGEYRYTGIGYPVYPERYQHICNKCGDATTFTKVYPAIRYEYVDESSQAHEEGNDLKDIDKQT